MEPIIHKLSTALANKIAAGEVVERPASVVKELIENSIDAGATQISITIHKSGVQRIQVTDNGGGINKVDLPLAITSHATSKIHTADDLNAITSLGFRGEALASIAAVSHFTLQSRSTTADVGYQITHNTTQTEQSVTTVAHPVGTTIIVNDLFYNIPARRKFLRSDKTEFNHIEEVVRRAALSRFEIGFQLMHGERTVWRLPIAASLIEKEKRIATLMGKAFLTHCVHVDIERAPLTLNGWIASAELARNQTDRQYCFINGRVIRDKLINHAIRQAYADTLPTGRYPSVILFLNCDPITVDVNVHPTKHEVRFHDARLVHDFIVRSIQDVLNKTSQTCLIDNDNTTSTQQANAVIDDYQRETWKQQYIHGKTTHQPTTMAKPVVVPEPAVSNQTNTPNHTIIGVFKSHYILLARNDNLIILDAKLIYSAWVAQHLTKQVTNGKVEQQPLLVPVRYQLTTSTAAIWAKHQSTLTCLGIDATELDINTLAIRHIPALLSQVATTTLVDTVFAALADRSDTSSALSTLITALAQTAETQLCQQPFKQHDIDRIMTIATELGQAVTQYEHCITPQTVETWFTDKQKKLTPA